MRSAATTTRAARPQPTCRTRGFSLIELVIVMGILAVLVGGVIVAIGIANESSLRNETRTTLAKASGLVEDFQTTFETLPPARLKRLGDATGRAADRLDAPNATNEGSECARRAAFVPGFRGRKEFLARERCNTDEDDAGALPLEEIRDAWDNPVVYIPYHAYARADEEGLAYVTHAGDLVSARPHRSADGGFVRPNGFQVFSMGPDGVPNTHDDVVGWER